MIERDKVSDNFWSKVDQSGDCWEWQASTRRGGYGQFMFEGKLESAPRVIFMLEGLDIPYGMHVLHKCDNPVCVHPDHLFLGTNQDNMNDKVKKDRQYRPVYAGNKRIR